MLVLLAMGLYQMQSFVSHQSATGHAVHAVGWAIFGTTLVIGAALGAARGYSARVWRDNERWLRRGTWLTLALWVVAIGVRIAMTLVLGVVYPAAVQLGMAGLLIYLATTLGVQQYVVHTRAARAAIA